MIIRNKKEILIGTRRSSLARKQTDLVIKELEKIGIKNIKIKCLHSKGDTFSYKKFKESGGKGLFTNDLDELVLKNKIDIAVHSSKDIPTNIHNSLEISGFLKREDVRDVLITRNFFIKSIEDIPIGSTFGSSSPRRISYIKYLRPDIIIKKLRGNIDRRMKKVFEGKIFFTILAKAGLKRLNSYKYDLNFSNIPLSTMLPSAGQGAIAIVQRKDNAKLKRIIRLIDHEKTRIAIMSERKLLEQINGNCFTPIGVYSEIKKDIIKLRTKLFSTDGSRYIEKTNISRIMDAKEIGKNSAQSLLEKINFKY